MLRKNFERPSGSLENYCFENFKNCQEVWLIGSKVQKNDRQLKIFAQHCVSMPKSKNQSSAAVIYLQSSCLQTDRRTLPPQLKKIQANSSLHRQTPCLLFFKIHTILKKRSVFSSIHVSPRIQYNTTKYSLSNELHAPSKDVYVQ